MAKIQHITTLYDNNEQSYEYLPLDEIDLPEVMLLTREITRRNKHIKQTTKRRGYIASIKGNIIYLTPTTPTCTTEQITSVINHINPLMEVQLCKK